MIESKRKLRVKQLKAQNKSLKEISVETGYKIAYLQKFLNKKQ